MDSVALVLQRCNTCDGCLVTEYTAGPDRGGWGRGFKWVPDPPNHPPTPPLSLPFHLPRLALHWEENQLVIKSRHNHRDISWQILSINSRFLSLLPVNRTVFREGQSLSTDECKVKVQIVRACLILRCETEVTLVCSASVILTSLLTGGGMSKRTCQ